MFSRLHRASLLFVTLLAIALPGGAAHADVELDGEEAETLYLIGNAVARTLTAFGLSEDELEIVQEGIEDWVLERTPKVSDPNAGDRVKAFHAKRVATASAAEKEESEAFLARQADLEGAVRTDSGLIITEMTAGKGESPSPTDTVKVHYHGTLRDGTVFDSSVDRGQPAEFPLNRVIPCWTEGVGRMKVGGKSRLVCPPSIAYGDRGAPQKIPGGAALVFEVELIEIQ